MKRGAGPKPRGELRPRAAGTIVGALVVVGAVVSGSIDESNATLQLMGFDPDRSQLITALIVGAIGAAASAVVTGRIGSATLLGLLDSAALFGGTFVAETRSASVSAGAAGSFDPGGWLITLLTLVVSGLVAGWAGAVLAGTARPAIADTFRMGGWIAGRLLMLGGRLPLPRLARGKVALWARLALARSADGRSDRRPAALNGRVARRATIMVLVTTLLLVATPVFGDLVNYSPDSHMLHGGANLTGLATQPATPTPSADPTLTPLPGRTLSAAATPSPSPTPFDPRPWLARRSSGSGHIIAARLPAPWKGGSAMLAQLAVYTPPGYDPNGSLRYPAIYEVPWGFVSWEKGADLAAALDTLISSGAMPPSIVVSIDAGGGPYPDSECANSTDGREWYDRFVAQTAVPWVDSHYRTIPLASARAVMGMSQGGYCAPILALHHPDVFGTSIAFSGYYHAGLAGPNSSRPFGGDPIALNGASPDVVVGQLAPQTRTHLYFIVVAQPGQAFYGPQADQFNLLLTVNGYPHLAIAATQPHGWAQVREKLTSVMEAWAARLVASGVF